MNTSQRILLTGQSGIRMARMIEKLRHYVLNRTDFGEFACESVEDHMVEIHVQDHPEEAFVKQRGGFQRLLLKPSLYLERLWHRAMARVQSRLPSQGLAIITMHAVFYHTLARQFISAVDYHQFKDLGIDKVITLVDDIYDVWARLSEPGQLFFVPHKDPPDDASPEVIAALCDEASLKSIASLMEILAWRSYEVFSSAEIARRIPKPPIVFPVKHCLHTAANVLFSDRRLVYVSHPIAEPRRLMLSDDATLGRELQAEVESLARCLRVFLRWIPICPTRVDELRIADRASAAAQGASWPLLTERWIHPSADESLWVPTENHEERALDPLKKERKLGTEVSPLIAVLLSVLREQITAQINSRDRQLVEQSHALVVWRPYFNGSLSTGARTEMRHRNLLVDWGVDNPGDKRCYIYSPRSDLAKWRAGVVAGALLGLDNPPSQSQAHSVREALVDDSQTFNALKTGQLDPGALRRIAENVGVSLVPGATALSRSAVAPDPRTQEYEWIQDAWATIAAQVNRADEVEKESRPGDYWCEEEGVKPEEFVEQVVKQWKLEPACASEKQTGEET